MAVCSQRHKELDEFGEGLCSVPMWSGGGPAGFCDRKAYGERVPTRYFRRWDGYEWAEDGRYAGYVPYLACPQHGGPLTRVFKDGNMWCAVDPDFINLQESPAGFGETPGLAREELMWAKRNPAYTGLPYVPSHGERK
jgi:hypothetical protein